MIFSPNTQSPDPDVAEGASHEWVATSGTDLAALLRWMEINGERFAFRG